jgi:Family of unknown function (DUF5681)
MVERFRPRDWVGYKKPPVHARFKKGQSGNPRGRPRRELTVAQMFAQEFQSSVLIMENGRRLRTNKLRLVFKRVINQAIAGDVRHFVSITQRINALENLRRAPAESRRPLEGIDPTTLSPEELSRRYREAIAASGGDVP